MSFLVRLSSDLSCISGVIDMNEISFFLTVIQLAINFDIPIDESEMITNRFLMMQPEQFTRHLIAGCQALSSVTSDQLKKSKLIQLFFAADLSGLSLNPVAQKDFSTSLGLINNKDRLHPETFYAEIVHAKLKLSACPITLLQIWKECYSFCAMRTTVSGETLCNRFLLFMRLLYVKRNSLVPLKPELSAADMTCLTELQIECKHNASFFLSKMRTLCERANVAFLNDVFGRAQLLAHVFPSINAMFNKVEHAPRRQRCYDLLAGNKHRSVEEVIAKLLISAYGMKQVFKISNVEKRIVETLKGHFPPVGGCIGINSILCNRGDLQAAVIRILDRQRHGSRIKNRRSPVRWSPKSPFVRHRRHSPQAASGAKNSF